MCKCSNGSVSLKLQLIHHTLHPYKMMGLIKVSNSFSKREQGLSNPIDFFILNHAFRPFSIRKLMEVFKLPVYFIVIPKWQYDFLFL